MPKGSRREIYIQRWSPFVVCKQEPTNVIAINDRSIDRSIDLPSRRNRFRGTIKYKQRLDRKISATPRDVLLVLFFNPLSFSSSYFFLFYLFVVHRPRLLFVSRWFYAFVDPRVRVNSLKGSNGSFVGQFNISKREIVECFGISSRRYFSSALFLYFSCIPAEKVQGQRSRVAELFIRMLDCLFTLRW